MRRLRLRLERVAQRPTSRIVALVLLGLIVVITLPLGIAFAWIEADQIGSFIHAAHNQAPNNDAVVEQGIFLAAATAVVVPIALALLAIATTTLGLAWSVVRSWRDSRVNSDLRSQPTV
jgi:hypothetical protein